MKNVIVKYQKLVDGCDFAIKHIDSLIKKAANDDSIDVEDLEGEKVNCNVNKRMYLQFIKDVENSTDSELLNAFIEIREYINRFGVVSMAMQNIKGKVTQAIKKATK